MVGFAFHILAITILIIFGTIRYDIAMFLQ